MSKKEFLEQLRDLLRQLPENEVKDILSDYEEHFRLGVNDNNTEEKICELLGSPEKIAKEYIELYNVQKNDQILNNTEYIKNNEEKIVSAKSIENLAIESIIADVIIKKVNREDIKIKYISKKNSNNYKLEVNSTGKTLKIKQLNNHISRITFFNSQSYKLIIELPNMIEFKKVIISSVSGDIEFKEIICRDLDVKSVSGDIILSGNAKEKASVKTTSGDLNYEILTNENNINTVSGDIKITSNKEFKANKIEISTISGDTQYNGNSNELIGKSVSGDFRCYGLNNVCKLKSRSGNINLDGECDNVNVDTASGDINVRRNIKSASFRSKSGDIMLDSDYPVDSIDCSSLSGDINLKLSNSNDIMFYVKTLSGDTNSSFPIGSNKISSKYKCTSKSGDINICKK